MYGDSIVPLSHTNRSRLDCGVMPCALPGGAKPSALLTMWGGGYTRIHLSYERQIQYRIATQILG